MDLAPGIVGTSSKTCRILVSTFRGRRLKLDKYVNVGISFIEEASESFENGKMLETKKSKMSEQQQQQQQQTAQKCCKNINYKKYRIPSVYPETGILLRPGLVQQLALQ